MTIDIDALRAAAADSAYPDHGAQQDRDWPNPQPTPPPTTHTPAPRNTWHDQAACAGTNPNIFFPGRNDHAAELKAKAICDSCPVKAKCAATYMHEIHGIWGGLTAGERRKIRKQRREKAA